MRGTTGVRGESFGGLPNTSLIKAYNDRVDGLTNNLMVMGTKEMQPHCGYPSRIMGGAGGTKEVRTLSSVLLIKKLSNYRCPHIDLHDFGHLL